LEVLCQPVFIKLFRLLPLELNHRFIHLIWGIFELRLRGRDGAHHYKNPPPIRTSRELWHLQQLLLWLTDLATPRFDCSRRVSNFSSSVVVFGQGHFKEHTRTEQWDMLSLSLPPRLECYLDSDIKLPRSGHSIKSGNSTRVNIHLVQDILPTKSHGIMHLGVCVGSACPYAMGRGILFPLNCHYSEPHSCFY